MDLEQRVTHLEELFGGAPVVKAIVEKRRQDAKDAHLAKIEAERAAAEAAQKAQTEAAAEQHEHTVSDAVNAALNGQ